MNIPPIKIGGVVIPAYSIEFSGGGQEKSTLKIDYVSRDGNFVSPDINSQDVVRITIGDFFKFDGYAVSYSPRRSTSSGKTLSVEYWDTSLILDKYRIGLRGLDGPGFGSVSVGGFQNLILVGRQIDPCEGFVSGSADPCAPDCEEREAPETFDCDAEKEVKILDVVYSFADFIAETQGIVSYQNIPPTINTNYYNRFTGTLREVLSQWCQEFGITFYWENNSIVFVDLRSGITINESSMEEAEIDSIEENFSIKENVAIGNITYFGVDGENRRYSCSRSSSKRLILRPITMADFFSLDTTYYGGLEDSAKKFIRDNYKNWDAFLRLCICNYYSEELRDLVGYYSFFTSNSGTNSGLGTVAEAQSQADLPLASKRVCHFLGNMRIHRVFSSASTGIDAEVYTKLNSRPSGSQTINNISKGVYYILADYNEDIHKKFIDFEKNIVDNFWGRYWIRYFATINSYTYTAPDGSVTPYADGTPVQFDFYKELPDAVRASAFLKKVIDRDGGDSEDLEARQSFLVMDRQAAWYPARNSNNIVKMQESVSSLVMEDLGEEDILGLNLIQPGQRIFKVFQRPTGFGIIEDSDNAVNPIDKDALNKRDVLDGISSGVGLQSASCRRFAIGTGKGTENVLVYTPSQSIGSSVSENGEDQAGYIIFANGSSFSNETVVQLPKMQVVRGDINSISRKSVAFQVNYRDVTQNLLKYLTGCGYNSAEIQNYMNTFVPRFYQDNEFEKRTITYSVFGIPEAPLKMSDGVQSFSLNYNSDGGIVTSVTFSNLPAVSPSDSFTQNRIEKNLELKSRKYFNQ